MANKINYANLKLSLIPYYEAFTKYQNGISDQVLFNPEFGEILEHNGFKNDCFNSYEKLGLPEQLLYVPGFNPTELQNVVEKLDIKVIGNMIYSQWRGVTLWKDNSFASYKQWFIIVMGRFLDLISENIKIAYIKQKTKK